jgi:murein DD-endopeptidase MepM/ murein hydrolase activator NlpD
MKRKILISLFLSGLGIPGFSQPETYKPAKLTYENAGEANDTNEKCIDPVEHTKIKNRLATSVQHMKEAGVLDKHFGSQRQMMHPLFDWPMRQADHFNDPGYYAISNYVDLDPTLNNVLDFNGLNQTYDGHDGIDIRTDPYFWKKKSDNHVEAIAGEDGIIIFKQDGNSDNNCSCAGSWNAVYLVHADGSISWYGHLKTNTTTPKDSGDFVAVGEYIGLIGSSGCSTNPHLHFEVYDDMGNRVEPFFGPSNNTTTESWWANQLPYYDSGINKIATHSASPTTPACPGLEVPNEKEVYDQGEAIFFSVAIRHSINTDSAKLEVFEPDGDQSGILDLTYIRSNPPFFLRTVLPVWNNTLANNAPSGKWKYRVTYYSDSYAPDIVETYFWVSEDCVADIVHNAALTSSKYYEASNTITSTSAINNNVHIVYDSENVTTLLPGFIAPVGSKFEVRLAGCN